MAIVKYRRRFETNSLLDVELWAFKNGLTVAQGGLGKAKHFENIVRELWPWFVWEDDFGPLGVPQEQVAALCENDVVGFTSGASSMKSDIMAKWALVNWFCDPAGTLVLVVSTSAKDAQTRIWGHVVRDWRSCRKNGKSVGKLIESMSIIKLSEKTDGEAASDNSSVCLIAAGSEFANDSLKRLEGKKAQRRLFLILDELQDCSDTVIREAIWNLNANPYFHVVASGNASDRNDPHGQFMKPIDGDFNSINDKTHKWKIKVGTKEGVAIHFDGEDSPNMKRFLAGRPELPFMRKAEEYLIAKQTLGEDSAQFLRQFRGFWSSKTDQTNYIVTDAALAVHRAYEILGQGFQWQSTPTGVLGIDPSYSEGGDRFEVMPIYWGLCTDGMWCLYFDESILLNPKPAPGESRDHASIRECKTIAEERGIGPRMVGMDASAGTPLLSIAHKEWSQEILAVPFGGAPTDLPVSMYDNRLASQLYANKTSELHYVFVEFLNNNHVRGVRPAHAKELTNRQFEIITGGKIRIESKRDMKKRLGFSPDISDAGAVGLAVIRERLMIKAGMTSGPAAATGDWAALKRKRDVITRSNRARQPGVSAIQWRA